MKKAIHVVAAIIKNDQNEILCALRSPKMTMSNLWEFPGGKIENKEGVYEALCREIKEELDCIIKPEELFHKNTYEDETNNITLYFISCIIIAGTPTATEHSKLIWLKHENLSSLKWAPADIPVVERLMREQ